MNKDDAKALIVLAKKQADTLIASSLVEDNKQIQNERLAEEKRLKGIIEKQLRFFIKGLKKNGIFLAKGPYSYTGPLQVNNVLSFVDRQNNSRLKTIYQKENEAYASRTKRQQEFRRGLYSKIEKLERGILMDGMDEKWRKALENLFTELDAKDVKK